MTDREMLELAAKAAGYDYEYTDHTGHGEFVQHQIRNEQGCLVDWNPREDDGDCARMETAIGSSAEWHIDCVTANFNDVSNVVFYQTLENYADHNGDKDKARRYASTRLAALILMYRLRTILRKWIFSSKD